MILIFLPGVIVKMLGLEIYKLVLGVENYTLKDFEFKISVFYKSIYFLFETQQHHRETVITFA